MKKTMVKSGKKEAMPFEKKEGVKPSSPMKQTMGKATMKKTPVKMKKC